MKLLRIGFSIFYSLGQITLGLLLHPYQTMQSLIQDRVFVPMALLPMGVLAIVTVFWRFLLVPVVQNFFSCAITPIWPCDFLDFTSNWLTFFIIYWQIMLLYLLFRFSRAWKKV